jgi:hypothetical protein
VNLKLYALKLKCTFLFDFVQGSDDVTYVALRITWFRNISVAQTRGGTQDFETRHRGVSKEPESLPDYVEMPCNSTINYQVDEEKTQKLLQ